MNPVILYRIDSTRRMHRFYRMEIQPDLFGEWCLMREWGRIRRSGQMRSSHSLPRRKRRQHYCDSVSPRSGEVTLTMKLINLDGE
jgi:predicted DNA-binding WGR domain protein